MIAVNNFAENGIKLPINSFQGITYGEQKILGKSTFSRGFSTFLITFHPSLSLEDEIKSKKSRNPLRKWISLKFPVLPCNTLKRVNK